MRKKCGVLFVVSAPSGAGKTTVELRALTQLRKRYSIRHGITYTTRAPREKEEHGRDFYFIEQGEFKQKIEDGFFLEWSSAYGNYYGTPRSILESVAQGDSFFLIIDRCGAQQVKQLCPDACLIHIVVPEKVSLVERLAGRGSESDQTIAHRLAVSERELEEERRAPLYDYTILNECLEQSVLDLVTLVEKRLEG